MQKSIKILVFCLMAMGFVAGANKAHAGGGPTYEQPGYTNPTSSTQPAPMSMASPTTSAAPTPPTQPAGVVAGLATQGLFKLAGNPTVYVALDGQLHPFTSEAAFKAWGFKFKDVQVVSSLQIGSYTIGSPLGIPDGSIVKTPGTNTSYIVFGGKKNLAMPDTLVEHLGLSATNEVTISVSDLIAIPFGPAITQ